VPFKRFFEKIEPLGGQKVKLKLEIVMNELRRFKHSADFVAHSSHIIESAAISASYVPYESPILSQLLST
jgi:hypothetical protein